jgi:hypothetical protein
MNLLQLRWSELVGAAFERLELIFQLQLFQKPENAVASRLLEPVCINMILKRPSESPTSTE